MSSSSPARAKCNKCECDFFWYMENAPFITDIVITGTCSDCLNGLKHVCEKEE